LVWAGITTDNEDITFKKIWLDPSLAVDLNYVKATAHSWYVNISSYWRTANGKLNWDVTIPADTKAVLALSVTDISKIKELGIMQVK